MTFDFSQMSAHEILDKINEQGRVDEQEIAALSRKLNADWVVDRDEVALLFQVNQAVGANDENCPSWTSFFADKVARIVVFDLDTPGEIDQSEGDWLADMVEQYGVGNKTETSLFAELGKLTNKIHGRIKPMIG